MSRTLILIIHLAGVFGFLLAHGTSAGMALSLRKDHDPAHMRRLLLTSEASFSILYVSLALVVVSGVYGASTLGYWGRGWTWAALGLLAVVVVVMGVLGGGRYSEVRKPLGIRYRSGFKLIDDAEPGTQEEVEKAAARQWPLVLLAAGVAALAAFLYLMIQKPF